MRIVAGSHRGTRLRAPAGRDIRPTGDRTREALFNLLANGRHGHPLAGQVVIDACAGTGALGLEAVSRGAGQALFLENDRQALEIIRANIAHLGVADTCQVLAVDVTRPGPPPGPGNILLLDPPYASDLGGPAISALAG
ncbi:MAG: RsmD family RNA methyltransferase, partial [Pseudomonadota bacterium]|nr:RsmD family RNA methyltransferase [Pseudomonadota bacterium]